MFELCNSPCMIYDVHAAVQFQLPGLGWAGVKAIRGRSVRALVFFESMAPAVVQSIKRSIPYAGAM